MVISDYEKKYWEMFEPQNWIKAWSKNYIEFTFRSLKKLIWKR